MPPIAETLAIAALVKHHQPLTNPGSTGALPHVSRRPLILQLGKQAHPVTLEQHGESYTLKIHSDTTVGAIEHADIRLIDTAAYQIRYEWEGIRKSAQVFVSGIHTFIDTGHGAVCIEDQTHRAPQAYEGPGSGQLKAPMDGAVTAIMVAAGDEVKKGQTLLVIEAMKMEHLIRADLDGVVTEITVQKGQQVKGKQRLGSLRQSA